MNYKKLTIKERRSMPWLTKVYRMLDAISGDFTDGGCFAHSTENVQKFEFWENRINSIAKSHLPFLKDGETLHKVLPPVLKKVRELLG